MIFDGLTVVGIILMVLLVAGWVFYNHYTEKIIKDLLKEIAQLERENKRLRHRLNADKVIRQKRQLTAEEQDAFIEAYKLDFPNSKLKRLEDVNKGFY